LARAKNTARAEARRRSRAAMREEDEAFDAQRATADEPVAEPRPSLFRMPNVGADLRALPGMFRTSRRVWLPFAMLAAGFLLMLGVYFELVTEGTGVYLPLLGYLSFATLVGLYVQFFFVPYGLFTFFIGGFVAPRASYLVGLLLGLFNGVLWSILIFLGTSVPSAVPDETPATTDALGNALYVIAIAVVYGTLAAAFAAWYRDFLRRTSARSRERRAEQEAKARARRRDERQAARRPG
jgi:hypothetical protein